MLSFYQVCMIDMIIYMFEHNVSDIGWQVLAVMNIICYAYSCFAVFYKGTKVEAIE